MASVFSKAIGSALVPLLGCVICHPAIAWDLSDEPIELLDTIEVPATYAVQEEREISIPQPDTTTFTPVNGLIVATIPKAPTVSQTGSKIVRDSIADRKGLWKSVRTMTQEERFVSPSEPDVTTFTPVNGPMVATIPKAPSVSQAGPKIARDSIADRKQLRKPVRPIKAERPLYPQVARKEGWEGTVILRLTINSGGVVKKVTTQKSSGFPALDESAMQSVKTWRFDPAKDGEFPVSTSVDLPVTFNLKEY